MSGASPGSGIKPCPICGKPADVGFAPFCSKRCADIDLHRWLKGAYALPDEESEPATDSAFDTDR